MNRELDLKVLQRLSNGIEVRQDIRQSIRAIFFQTGLEEWPYATHGGTAFIVNYSRKLYGITARHVPKDFEWSRISITDQKFGSKIAGIEAIYFPNEPRGAAIGSDILDIAIIEFGDDIDSGFFNDTAYILDSNTAGTSKPGDKIYICGALKEMSEIDIGNIRMVFGSLDMSDGGNCSWDPTLRVAFGEFKAPDFKDITGLSGSPVFNWTRGKLAGMLLRGQMTGAACQGYYMDIFDILEVINAVHQGKTDTYYLKKIQICGDGKKA